MTLRIQQMHRIIFMRWLALKRGAAVLGVILIVGTAGCGPLPGYSEPPLLDRASGPSLPDYRGNGGMGPGGVNGGMGDTGGIQGGGGPAIP